MLDYKNINKIEFEKIVLQSNSGSDICRALKLPINKRGFDIIRKLLKKFNLNTNHFDKSKWHKRKYLIVEKACDVCGVIFESTDGSKKTDRKYCSQRCANSISHTKKEKKKCLTCGNKVKSNKAKFCSHKCCGRYAQLKTFQKIEDGTYKRVGCGTSKNNVYKLYLIEKYGYGCMCCDNVEWMGQPIPLQLEHEDGDSDNDDLKNLKLLCPNCHAQTPTYCGKNIGKGKNKRRMEDYHAGKNKW